MDWMDSLASSVFVSEILVGSGEGKGMELFDALNALHYDADRQAWTLRAGVRVFA